MAPIHAGHQDWLGHRSIQHTVRYTELSPSRARKFGETERAIDRGSCFGGPIVSASGGCFDLDERVTSKA
jgi:hypothetical protein